MRIEYSPIAVRDLERVWAEVFEASASEEAATKIENWYKKTAHKRHLPITIYDTFWQ